MWKYAMYLGFAFLGFFLGIFYASYSFLYKYWKKTEDNRLLALEKTVKEFCEKFKNDKKLEGWIGTFEIMTDDKSYNSLNEALRQKAFKRVELK